MKVGRHPPDLDLTSQSLPVPRTTSPEAKGEALVWDVS
jgi:hypothetical protein